jgi:Sec-independent protein translocase protein TatA
VLSSLNAKLPHTRVHDLPLSQQFTILLVGYFVLGPSDLYKLVKSIGSFVQNARTLGSDLTKTFESNMESQLQLEEIRKAQRELNDAFSFRRSINVDQTGDAFSTTVTSPREGQESNDDTAPASSSLADESAAVAASGAPKKKKKLKRRRKFQAEASGEEGTEQDASSVVGYDVPDLKMPGRVDEEQVLIDEEFDKYTSLDDLSAGDDEALAATATAEEEEAARAASLRFQQQLSGSWNDQILASEDVLSTVLRKLSLLEEEKAAATKRLEEEFEKRSKLEETYYSRQREVLESALRQVEQQVVGSSSIESAAPNNRK